MAFIEENVKQDKPFFAYIPTNAPHGPFHDVPQELYEKYAGLDLEPVLLGNEDDADRVARFEHRVTIDHPMPQPPS